MEPEELALIEREDLKRYAEQCETIANYILDKDDTALLEATHLAQELRDILRDYAEGRRGHRFKDLDINETFPEGEPG